MRSVLIEFGMWRCERSGSASGSITRGNGRSRAAPGAGRSRGGESLLLGDQEAVGGDAKAGMMVEAAPAAAFVMTEADLLPEVLIVALDPPTQLGLIDQLLKADIGRPGAEPVVVRFGFALRPFDQQPLVGRGLAVLVCCVCGPHTQSDKARRQRCVAALPPGYRLPGVGSEFLGQRFDLDRSRGLAIAVRAGAGGTSPGRQTSMLEKTPTT